MTLGTPPATKATTGRQWLSAFWTFSRPHTLIGTSLSVFGLAVITYAIPVIPIQSGSGPDFLLLLWSVLGSWLPCLCGNIYIVGLNQLTDVEIDRINKPKLPLASGAFTQTQGRRIVLVTGLLAVGLAAAQGPYLLVMVLLSLLIGTAYSLPPIRLKRFAVWAALCIFGVRGVIVNLGLYGHFHQKFWSAGPDTAPPALWALTLFIVVYTFAIAIFKDIPDLEGDRKFQIRTLTVRVGGRFVFNLARWVMTACYLGMIAVAWGLPSVHTVLIVLTHLTLMAILWWRSFGVNLLEKSSVRRYYQLIWQLFYWEYILFPLACLWR